MEIDITKAKRIRPIKINSLKIKLFKSSVIWIFPRFILSTIHDKEKEDNSNEKKPKKDKN